ncbi:MAG TPA: hypothetical protein VK945_05550 [Planococcus sp. (in: firmicutes)]|nr:hypothetical protein [Planococcus sp. (in: firmicutes)]
MDSMHYESFQLLQTEPIRFGINLIRKEKRRNEWMPEIGLYIETDGEND